MMRMMLGQAARAVDGRLINADDATAERIVTNVVTDSRKAHDGSLFVAIAGEHVDGHDFVARIGEQGALGAIVDHEIMGDRPRALCSIDAASDRSGLVRTCLNRERAQRGIACVVGLTLAQHDEGRNRTRGHNNGLDVYADHYGTSLGGRYRRHPITTCDRGGGIFLLNWIVIVPKIVRLFRYS